MITITPENKKAAQNIRKMRSKIKFSITLKELKYDRDSLINIVNYDKIHNDKLKLKK